MQIRKGKLHLGIQWIVLPACLGLLAGCQHVDTDTVQEDNKGDSCYVCSAYESGTPITQVRAEMIPPLVELSKSGCLRSTRLLAEYYEGFNCAECLKWELLLRKQAAADPAQKVVNLDKLNQKITLTKQRIAAYDLSEHGLRQMIDSATGGDVYVMDTVFHYHLEHHEFSQALYWLEEIRAQVKSVAASDEDLRLALDTNYDALRDKVLDRQKAYKLLN